MNTTFKDTFLEKYLLFILSFLTASFLWFYVVNSEPITLKRTIKVNVKAPIGLAVESVNFLKVDVTLRGARAFLKQFQDNGSELVIDLSKKRIGNDTKVRHHLSVADFTLPFGVDITEILPEYIEIDFDKEIRKRVPIKISYMGELQSQLQLVNTDLSPSNIMIEGARNILKTISFVKTSAVDLSSLSGEDKVELELGELPGFVNYLDPSNLVFSYNVRPKKANLTLKKIEIKFVTSHQKFKASSKLVSMDVLTTDDSSISASEVKVYAEIPDGKKGQFDVRLRAELPNGVHLLNINPAIIKVNIY